MSRLTSGERRGSILLIIIGAVIILTMALAKGFLKSEISEIPVADDESLTSDKSSGEIADSAIKVVVEKTDSVHARRTHKTKKTRVNAPAGRSRDFLSEPVRGE